MPNPTIRPRHASAAALVALAVTALAACGDNDATSNEPSTTTTTTTTVADPATEIPDTPVGEQLRWALDHLASDAQPLTVDEVKEHVSAEFLRDVFPADTVVALLDHPPVGRTPRYRRKSMSNRKRPRGRPSKYPPEFQRDAVAMVLDEGRAIAEVARAIGVNEGTLGNWVAKARRERSAGVGSERR